MSAEATWPWVALLLLGAFHGLNPGMGWLFAVALGLQERRRRAVLRAFGPIAAGHAASVSVVVLLLGAAQLWVDAWVLRVLGGAALVAFGLYKLLVPLSHPRWVGMRVGPADLAVWSFLMASAHGAGLMLVPILLAWTEQGGNAHMAHAGHMHAGHLASKQMRALAAIDWLGAVGVHTLGYLLITTLIALLVYEKLGLALLRRAWFNLDLLWVIALMISGGVILLI